MNKNIIYHLAFSYCYGIGPMKFKLLIENLGGAEKAFKAKRKDLEKLLGINLAYKFINFRQNYDFEKEIKEIRKKNIQVVCQEDENYPPQLKNISDTPICLFVKGDLKNLNFNNKYLIGIVGTRKPTAYGQQIAKEFSSGLAAAGFIIVSGMAIGIDTIAHQSALDYKAKTIAVLGCGVDIVYPSSNFNLYYKIIKNNGLVISEFPPGRTVMRGLFVARNRIISGLSKGIVVVEGAKDSGALITARYAAEQGREVFAPPSPITSYLSEAPNLLLKQGAKLITKVDDILEEFDLRISPKKNENTNAGLNQEEKDIFNILEEAKSADEIVEKINRPIEKILNVLSMLEIKGIIEKNSEGKYQLKV